MEKLQGPINPCLISEDLEVGNWLEEFISNTTKFEDPYTNNNNNNNTEEEEGGYCNYYYGDYSSSPQQHFTLPSLEDKMPFLQMLQSVESSHHLHHHHYHHQQQQQTTFPLMQLEPNFQFLLRLQHQKLTCFTSTTTTTPDMINHNTNHIINPNNDGLIIMDLHSSSPGLVKSETDKKNNNNNQNSGVAEEEVSEVPLKCNSSSRSKRSNNNKNNNNDMLKTTTSSTTTQQQNGGKEKRKRKRTTRPAKNKEEVETQRMTHIAVERNRRRQMNEHLSALRSLMPPSYAQRGDQASIIGGAIDFVKELEQMLQSLQAQKKMRQSLSQENNLNISSSTTSTTTTTTTSSSFMDSSSYPFHHLTNPIPLSQFEDGNGNESLLSEEHVRRRSSNNNEEYSAEKKSALADIEVVVIQNHVNLKIQCQRRPGQLLKAIVAFEELRLTVLHLNITSLHTLVHYSFNLKIEDDCKLGSADEVARAVHQIFSFINLS